MTKIGFTTLLNQDDSVLSPHFGKAKWVMIRDDSGKVTFVQNTGLSGGAVVNILQHHGCTEAVFAEIGPGAFRHLQQAGIRGWLGPANVPIAELLARLSRGELPAAKGPTSPKARTGHSEHAGSGCSRIEADTKRVGGATGCCGQQSHRHGIGRQLAQITDSPYHK